MNQYSINSYAFNSAHELFKRKDNTLSFSQCLTIGWNAAKLFKQLSNGITSFQFIKANKELRTANGTRNKNKLIELFNLRFEYSKDKPKVKKFSVIEFYDLDKLGFRSFRIDRLI